MSRTRYQRTIDEIRAKHTKHIKANAPTLPTSGEGAQYAPAEINAEMLDVLRAIDLANGMLTSAMLRSVRAAIAKATGGKS